METRKRLKNKVSMSICNDQRGASSVVNLLVPKRALDIAYRTASFAEQNHEVLA